jgi:site-specific DNA-cytosine methylase
MKVLELFAGSRSIGKAAEKLGMQVYSSDINNFENIDYVTDILKFDCSKVPFVPDILWASPPCTFFSVASIGKHWNKDNTPKTESAVLGVTIVKKTIEIIHHFQKLNSNLIYYVENPRGKLRKLSIMNFADIRNTVTYCKYGDDRMKPTDIWTNNKYWNPKPICSNGDTCHKSAPRGSQTGTQGMKNSYEKSKIPEELCIEVLENCITKLTNGVRQLKLNYE